MNPFQNWLKTIATSLQNIMPTIYETHEKYIYIYKISLLLYSLPLVCLMPCMDEGHFQKGGFSKVIITLSYTLQVTYMKIFT